MIISHEQEAFIKLNRAIYNMFVQFGGLVNLTCTDKHQGGLG